MFRRFKYNKLLLDSIKDEKAGEDYICPESDKPVLKKIFKEINKKCKIHIKYLAELDEFHVKGSGEIIAKHIKELESESVKAFLIPQMVADKVEGCDKLILEMYCNFKESKDYISRDSAHIYVRYDNAFKTLKPKTLKNELTKFAYSPSDAVRLPLTIRMIASWKIPELKSLMISYLQDTNSTVPTEDVKTQSDDLFPASYVNRELKFIAIHSLQYYPDDYVKDLIVEYTHDSDTDIKAAASKALKKIDQRMARKTGDGSLS